MKRHNHKIYFFFLILGLSFTYSCTPLKKLKYIQTTENTPDTLVTHKDTYKLQKGDNIYIDITTSNTEFRSYVFSQKAEGTSGSANNIYLYLISYQIDEKGFIYIPFIEPLMAYNKTLDEVQAELQMVLSEYLTDVTVSIKMVNFSFTILGEVNNPGQQFAINNHVNILEAIGIAGDLTIYGNRKNIKIMRKLQNGNYKIEMLDITKAEVASNPFFALQPNDIIYIEPHRTKSFGLGTFQLGTMLTIITTTLFLINALK